MCVKNFLKVRIDIKVFLRFTLKKKKSSNVLLLMVRNDEQTWCTYEAKSGRKLPLHKYFTVIHF